MLSGEHLAVTADDSSGQPPGNASASATPAEGRIETKASWKLVWCFERCHKPENESLRRDLGRVASDSGGTLVCLKKALRFRKWVEDHKGLPYVLVTDWREAQPCLQAVQQADASSKPSLMSVVCCSRRQVKKAHEWAASSSSEVGSMWVCEAFDAQPDHTNCEDDVPITPGLFSAQIPLGEHSVQRLDQQQHLLQLQQPRHHRKQPQQQPPQPLPLVAALVHACFHLHADSREVRGSPSAILHAARAFCERLISDGIEKPGFSIMEEVLLRIFDQDVDEAMHAICMNIATSAAVAALSPVVSSQSSRSQRLPPQSNEIPTPSFARRFGSSASTDDDASASSLVDAGLCLPANAHGAPKPMPDSERSDLPASEACRLFPYPSRWTSDAQIEPARIPPGLFQAGASAIAGADDNVDTRLAAAAAGWYNFSPGAANSLYGIDALSAFQTAVGTGMYSSLANTGTRPQSSADALAASSMSAFSHWIDPEYPW